MQIIWKGKILVREDCELGVWVGWCPRFDLFSQGTSLEEAIKAIEGTVVSWVSVCYRRGILDACLDKLGFDSRATSGSFTVGTDAAMKYPTSVR